MHRPTPVSTLILNIHTPSEPTLRLKRHDSPLSRALLTAMGRAANNVIFSRTHSGPVPIPSTSPTTTLVCVTVEHITL